MGFLDGFESKIERTVDSVFSRFGSKNIQPVDLMRLLEREINDKATQIDQEKTMAPNEYRLSMSTPDFDQVIKWGAEALANELSDKLTNYAEQQHYSFSGPVVVIFEENTDIPQGRPQVSSQVVQGKIAPVTDDKSSPRDFPVLEISGRQYLLTAAKTVIGRGSDCDIVIDDPGVSRHHVEIEITPQHVVARDMGSTNGTYVEGHLVPAASLIDGNTITIGRTRMLFWAGSEPRN